MRITVCFIFLIVAATCYAQVQSSHLRFTHYTIADGLPTNTVNRILQDKRGFIWFATAQGLSRFDGKNFTNYGHSSTDSNSMPYDRIDEFALINNNELLLKGGEKIWLFNILNGRQHPPPAYWQSKTIFRVIYLRNDLLALQTPDKIYFADYNLAVFDSIALAPLAIRLVDMIYLGKSRILFKDFIPTAPTELYYLYSLATKKTEVWKIPVPINTANNFFYLKQADTLQQILYFGKYGQGAYILSYNATDSLYLQPKLIKGSAEHASVNNIFVSNKTMYIDVAAGLIIYYPGGEKKFYPNATNTIDKSGPLSGSYCNTISDRWGGMWGACNYGVNNFNIHQNSYRYWKLPGNYNVTVNRFSKYDNKLWLGNDLTGTMYLDLQTQQVDVLDSNIIRYCWGIKPVNGSMYIYGNSPVGKYNLPAYNTKLLIYNPAEKRFSSPSFLKKYTDSSELITLIHPAKNGDVWYSINHGGGLVRQQGNTFTHYANKDNPPPFPFRYLNVAAEDAQGNIYFSVNKDQRILVWKNTEQHFETWWLDSLLHSPIKMYGPVSAHIVDSRQNLWVSMEQTGLIRYNLLTKQGKWYKTEDGLQSNVSDCIVNDEADNIWIPTEKGLSCLLAATDRFVTFTEEDGLPFTNMKEAYLFFDNADTSLYISKQGYLYQVKTHPLLAAKNTSSAQLFIDAMMVNTRPYYFGNEKNISLGADQKNLQFSFVLLDLQHTISNRNFEYQLIHHGNSSGWQKLINTNTIAFTDLEPGTYTLQARIMNDVTGAYIHCSNPFTFHIDTVWYKTWWFRLLLSAAVMGFLFLLLRNYFLRKLEKQKALLEKERALEAERQRIAADMHDDIGAGLSRIRYITAAMKEGKQMGHEEMDLILSLSDESVEKMNEIIWSLNQGNRSLEDTLVHLRSQCAEMVTQSNIEFVSNLPDHIPDRVLSWAQTRNIYLLAKEAVNNAVKHADATSIQLAVQITNDMLILTVTDNGKGFDHEALHRGNGLKGFSKRVQALNGTFRIYTANPTGTGVDFEIPL